MIWLQVCKTEANKNINQSKERESWMTHVISEDDRWMWASQKLQLAFLKKRWLIVLWEEWCVGGWIYAVMMGDNQEKIHYVSVYDGSYVE